MILLQENLLRKQFTGPANKTIFWMQDQEPVIWQGKSNQTQAVLFCEYSLLKV